MAATILQFIPLGVAVVFSVAANIYYLAIEAPKHAKTRLLARQLQSLNWAMLLCELGGLVYVLAAVMRCIPDACGLDFCFWFVWVYRITNSIVWVQYGHLTAVFFLQAVRSVGGVMFLNKSVRMVWFVGALVGISDVLESPYRLHSSIDCSRPNGGYVSVGLVIGGTLVTGASFAAAIARARLSAPASVQRVMWLRAVGFTLAQFFCGSAYVAGRLLEKHDRFGWLWSLTQSVYASAGWIIVLMFRVLVRPRQKGASKDLEFDVTFRCYADVVVVDNIGEQARSRASMEIQLRSGVSQGRL
mmetsp:Transcript_16284/g.37318  ORF Transcript_16284/g.37318 Transcript_16284/m.37318 type:complete len:301 (-) Transcript_16284:430-1332(-)